MNNSINTYKNAFANLHVKVIDGRKLPNKAILLISVMDLVRCGYISENCIKLDDTIKIAFENNWKIFVNTNTPIVWTPFWHMKKESFWHFKPIHSLKDIENLVRSGETASISKMRNEIEYAFLDDALFEIISVR